MVWRKVDASQHSLVKPWGSASLSLGDRGWRGDVRDWVNEPFKGVRGATLPSAKIAAEAAMDALHSAWDRLEPYRNTMREMRKNSRGSLTPRRGTL